MKKIWNNYKHIIAYIMLTVVIPCVLYAIGWFVGRSVGRKECITVIKPPVEKVVIDTLYVRRDSIINKIQYLEVIKHDTIQKVYVLDDDATIDLFYKLVSE